MLNLKLSEDRVAHGGFRGGRYMTYSLEMTTMTTRYRGGGLSVIGTLE